MQLVIRTLCIAQRLALAVVGAVPYAGTVSAAQLNERAELRYPQTAENHFVLLATAYEHGEGVARDMDSAYFLYCIAAREGSADAQYALGWMYANGRGTNRDENTAASLFQLAAQVGHVQAGDMHKKLGERTGKLPPCLRERMPEPPHTVVMPPAPEVALVDDSDPFLGLPPDKRRIVDLIRDLAKHFGIEPRLALAIAATESNFDPNAQSPANARGLMQLIPETAARFSVKDPFDPRDNVRGGLAYLRWLLSYYRGRVELVAAAYNAGENAVDRHRGVPPYAETQEYVRRIQRVFSLEKHPYDPNLAGPSPLVRRPVRIGM